MKLVIVLLVILFYSTNGLSCQKGYILSSLNSCIQPQYIEGCNQYMSMTSCKICEYRYQLQPNGLCQINNQTVVECCSLKYSNKSCLKCQLGLYLINGRCQQSNIVGCIQKDSQGVCLNCASNYYLRNGLCQKSIKDCRQYTNQSNLVCSNCNSGFSLINNICIINSVLGCKNQLNQICKECWKPFLLIDGNCQIQNCKSYNDYRCVACQCGFYLTSNGICKPMEFGCIRYQREKCIDCLTNYRLKGGKCEIQGCIRMNGINCTACSENYDLKNSGCALKNCLSWKDGYCDICNYGYSYMKGQCIQNKSLHEQ